MAQFTTSTGDTITLPDDLSPAQTQAILENMMRQGGFGSEVIELGKTREETREVKAGSIRGQLGPPLALTEAGRLAEFEDPALSRFDLARSKKISE